MQFAVLIGHDLSKIHLCRCNPPNSPAGCLRLWCTQEHRAQRARPGLSLHITLTPSLRKHDCAPGSDQVLDRPQWAQPHLDCCFSFRPSLDWCLGVTWTPWGACISSTHSMAMAEKGWSDPSQGSLTVAVTRTNGPVTQQRHSRNLSSRTPEYVQSGTDRRLLQCHS